MPLTHTEISQAVLNHPKIVHGFLHHIEELNHRPIVRVPGGAGAMQYQDTWETRFRVCLYTDKGFADETSKDEIAAVVAAFEKLHLKLPSELMPAAEALKQTERQVAA